MKLTYRFLVFLIIIYSACDVSIPLPEIAPKPVIVATSLFTPDSIWQVKLTESFPLSQANQITTISNGTVEIQNMTDALYTTLTHQQDGIYTSKELLPKSNETYQLTVQVNGFETAQAVNLVPKPFTATLNNFQFTVFRNLPTYLFNLQIDDDPEVSNFYLISVTYLFEKKDSLFTQQATHFSLDPNSDNELVEIDHTQLSQCYLPDHAFNGQIYQTEIGASSFLLNQPAIADRITAIIDIRSISKEGYQHAQTTEAFQFSGSFSSAEPVRIFSNIENGFGVFAGFAQQRIEVRLK